MWRERSRSEVFGQMYISVIYQGDQMGRGDGLYSITVLEVADVYVGRSCQHGYRWQEP
jgi:hypothetical protein